MNYSKSGLALTERFEGCKLVAYQDQGGTWTIGYGHTKGVKPGDTCTPDQAEQWLIEDTKNAEDIVNKDVIVPLTQGEYDSLVDFVFNLGGKDLEISTLLKLLNSSDYQGAANEFVKWDHVGGKEVAGLLNRRLAEKQEFES